MTPSFIFSKAVIIIFLSLKIAEANDWTGISECGIYSAKGVVRATKKGLVLAINEKTMSEITLTVPIINEPTLAPYVDKAVESNFLLIKKNKGSLVLGKITKIDSRIPNPLDPMDTGVKFVSKEKCGNSK